VFAVIRKLFRRTEFSPEEKAERERVNREAAQARNRAERDIALRNAHVEAYLDRHPPDGGPY
jgi:hypothetical protein